MFRVSKKSNMLHVEMRSDLRLIQQINGPCKEFFGQYNVEPGRDVFLVLRELISNAVQHGNKGDAKRLVRVSMQHLSLPADGAENQVHHFTINVEDEGTGFDYQAQSLSLPQKGGVMTKRGLRLVHALVDEMTFGNAGSSITVYLHFNPCIQEKPVLEACV